MILSALADYCDQLRSEGRLPEPGWSHRNVLYFLVLSEDGTLRNIVRTSDEKRGRELVVPEQVKRAVNIAANFLCDTSSYLLGCDNKKKTGSGERARKCFEVSRELHRKILEGVESPVARAILAFFDAWDPEKALEDEAVARVEDELLAGGMLTFSMIGASGEPMYAIDDALIKRAWNLVSMKVSVDDPVMTCLVTGEHGPIARLHPSIKGVAGAQSSGATLVGFNKPAFESYGHEKDRKAGQGSNAPVSVHIVRAYTAALNYLLSRPGHRVLLGDTTVVYWSERADQGNCEALSSMMGGMRSDAMSADEVDKLIDGVMKAVSKGRPVAMGQIDLKAKFYVLGLAPSTARLSVRFFIQDSFGSILRHVIEHYECIRVRHKSDEQGLTPRALLLAVEKKEDAEKITAPLATTDELMRAILKGAKYPEALYENALLRIRAKRDVTYPLAAILKGYLLRNKNYSEEELTVELNKQSKDRAYTLGRVFAVLEKIQYQATGSKTLVSHYISAASIMPGMVFPSMLNMATKAHLTKIERTSPGLAVHYSRTLTELLGKGEEPHSLPKRFSIDEQGSFFLGYYAQRWQPSQPKDSSAADQSQNAGRATETQEA